jgi:serine/threonine protein kinase
MVAKATNPSSPTGEGDAAQVELLLGALGISLLSSNDDVDKGKKGSRVFSAMERWLGLVDDNECSEFPTLQDEIDALDGGDEPRCSPLVISRISQWLTSVWSLDPSGSSVEIGIASTPALTSASVSEGMTSYQNLLVEALNLTGSGELFEESPTLYHVWTVVRVTQWIQRWILAVASASDLSSLSVQLLTNTPEDTSKGTLRIETLIRALYVHIQQLPAYQSHLDRYISYLQQRQAHQLPSRVSLVSTASSSGSGSAALLQQQQKLEKYTDSLRAEWKNHLDRVSYILQDWYVASNSGYRIIHRQCLGIVWSRFVTAASSASPSLSISGVGGGFTRENTQATGIDMTLLLLHRILRGVQSSRERAANQSRSSAAELSPSYEHLLTYHLIPLHRPSGLVLWRDQTPVLELYHEPLTQCIGAILQLCPSLIPTTISSIVTSNEIFSHTSGQSSKLVLMLHEIDTYVGLIPTSRAPGFEEMVIDEHEYSLSWFLSVLASVSQCISSDHSRVAERAMMYFRNEKWNLLVQMYPRESFLILLRALVPPLTASKRGDLSGTLQGCGSIPWNPTVRKMTHLILNQLRTTNEAEFVSACDTLASGAPSIVKIPHTPAPRIDSMKAAQVPEKARTNTGSDVPPSLSLKAGMGAWRPPTTSQHSRLGLHGRSSQVPPSRLPPTQSQPVGVQPPLTITGVAPWAMSGPTASSKSNPPVTITGVAPWALPQAPSRKGGRSQQANAMLPPMSRKPKLESNTIEEEGEVEVHIDGNPHSGETEKVAGKGLGYTLVLEYMKRIEPPKEDMGISTWATAQMSETPTLLPNLKFHDLVFGHDLGEGAFGVVRYARLIDKEKTRSKWSEYAVKIVSTAKIRELGYEASIQREIAVLRIVSHPGVARLVSSFRFKDGAYLVLEYASRGDLHSLLRKTHGSLDHNSTRFVMGEVLAALASLHDLGLVFADLKPENILITEPGHIKLTDFGGCRPVTEQARKRIEAVSRNLLTTLRDGDWKVRNPPETSSSTDGPGIEEDVQELKEDARVEGTTAYLPPEVVMGAFPALLSDSWAFGCVLYQCLSGRPPLLDVDDAATRTRIVSFDTEENVDGIEQLFQGSHASKIEPSARALISSLLERNPLARPSMQEIAKQEFFASVDVFALHTGPAHPLDVGEVAPAPDAKWSRRQFSSIWAPQPIAYDMSLSESKRSQFCKPGTIPTTPIAEGEESVGFFSVASSLKITQLGNISEGEPMLLDEATRGTK